MPTLALVENMAYFTCEGGGRHYPFGRRKAPLAGEEKGEGDPLTDHFLPGPERSFQLPISTSVHDANEAGTPLCCDPGHGGGMHGEELTTFSNLADAVAEDLLLLQHGKPPSSLQKKDGSGGNSNILTVILEDEAGGNATQFDVPFTQLSVDNNHRRFTVRLFSDEGGYQKVIPGDALRHRDPRTGEADEPIKAASEENPSRTTSVSVQHHTATRSSCSSNSAAAPKTDIELFPAKVSKKGNYGYEVEWADGAKVIYSLLAIATAAGGKRGPNSQ